MWPKAKRAVNDDTAAQIAAVARQHGAQPVGVFVDEDAQTIYHRCSKAGISIAQLHGDAARSSLPQIPPELQVIYVMHVTSDGQVTTPMPQQSSSQSQRQIDWVLLDGQQVSRTGVLGLTSGSDQRSCCFCLMVKVTMFTMVVDHK